VKLIRIVRLTTLAITLLSWQAAHSDSTDGITIVRETKSIQLVRAPVAPQIDGNIDEAAWQAAAMVEDFHQTQPTDGALPTEPTIVRVMYDDDFLYVSAQMLDSEPDKIVASQMIQGKNIVADDRFWVTVDSFNGKRNDYFFQVNANGVRREALRENNLRFIDEWDAIWYSAASVTEDGWVAEIAIPFKSISFDPNNETWGVNFGRGIVRKQEFNMWSSFERQDWPAYGGEMHGIDGITQGTGLDVVPSLVIKDSDIQGSELRPSLDVFYKITPSLSTALTINTDFSGAEIDDRRVNLSRFSLFFPEKRDFFLQDAGIFEFADLGANGRPFFSRRIGLSDDGEAIDLDVGVKVTGRVGRFNVGLLDVQQAAHGEVESQNLLVGRVSANLLEESTVGMILTQGDPTSNVDNSLVGADFLFLDSDGLADQILRGKAWVQQTDTEGLAGDDLAYGLGLSFPNDRIRARVDFKEIQENFNPALGFVNRVGIRQYNNNFRYRVRPDEGKLRNIDTWVWYDRVTDLANKVESEFMGSELILANHTGDRTGMMVTDGRELINESFDLFGQLNVPIGDYQSTRFLIWAGTGNQRRISGSLRFGIGDFYGGDREEITGDIQWRQSRHLFLGFSYSQNKVELDSGNFTSRLAGLRADLALNSEWSWRTVAQYDNVSESAGLNTRLNWIPEPGREMTLVINKGWEEDLFNRFTPVEQDLSLKVSHTFRF
jgi:hypothetical protein